MGKINQIINQIAISCQEEKGQYEWLDDILDKIVENAKTILPLLPDEDIFEHSKVNFICEDHHDGFIHEVWITLEDNEEGLCIAIDDLGFSILNGSADVFGSWDFKEEKPYNQIAKEMYEFAKNNLNGETTI